MPKPFEFIKNNSLIIIRDEFLTFSKLINILIRKFFWTLLEPTLVQNWFCVEQKTNFMKKKTIFHQKLSVQMEPTQSQWNESFMNDGKEARKMLKTSKFMRDAFIQNILLCVQPFSAPHMCSKNVNFNAKMCGSVLCCVCVE